MTPTALADRAATTPATLPKDQIDLIKRTVANGATNDELALFLYDCDRRGIHPLDKLLHFTKRGGRYTPVTSIDFMRAQAAMSGEMAGNDDPIFVEADGKLVSASVTVYRMTQGQRFPYAATARWAEYCPDNAPMWKRMPHTMLGKCAEALALRKAFPQQLAGLYSREEMDQADGPKGGYVVEAPSVERVASDPTSAASSKGKTAAFEAVDAGSIPAAAANDADLPPGGRRVQRVEANKRGASGEITFTNGEVYVTYKPQVLAIAEQFCQNATPCFPDLKKSASGNDYLVGLVTIPPSYATPTADDIPPLTDADIPF